MERKRKLVGDAYEYLAEHMDRHVTIKELANCLSVSETTLKRTFVSIYGESVYVCLRKQKMYSAARMLRETKHSILYIAGAHGYSNASKFSSAFYKVMGVNPGEYRKRCGEMERKGGTTRIGLT